MSLSPIPIRILHKVCMLHVSLCFLRQNDRLAAYANQLLQSVLSAQIFGSGLLWMTQKNVWKKERNPNKQTKAKNTTTKHPPPQSSNKPNSTTPSLPQAIKLYPTQHSEIQRILQFVCYRLWEHNAKQHYCMRAGAQIGFIKIFSLHCPKARAAWPQALDSKEDVCVTQNNLAQVLEKAWTHQCSMLYSISLDNSVIRQEVYPHHYPGPKIVEVNLHNTVTHMQRETILPFLCFQALLFFSLSIIKTVQIQTHVGYSVKKKKIHRKNTAVIIN